MGLMAGLELLGRCCRLTLMAAAAVFLVPHSARAQGGPPPEPLNVDERGVDLTTGKLVLSATDLMIGPSDHHGLRMSRQLIEGVWRLSDLPTLTGSTSNPIVSAGGRSMPFSLVSSVYKPDFEDGSTLVWDGTKHVYTGPDGTVIEFGHYGSNVPLMPVTPLAVGTKITFPDGVVWTFHFTTGTYNDGASNFAYVRPSSITTSTGYQIKLTYASNTIQNYPGDWATFFDWKRITKSTAINNAIEYCDPSVTTCTLTSTWPEATYSQWFSVMDSVTGPGNATTIYGSNGWTVSSIRQPGATYDLVTYQFSASSSPVVVSVAVGPGVWSYDFTTAGATTVTDPASNTRTVTYSDRLITSTAAGGQTTGFTYCGASEANCPKGLLKRVTMPEGNYVQYAYDSRGNRTSEAHYAKSGTGLATITTSATYPGSCTSSNFRICNKPETTTDARNKVTNYDWNADHGGLNHVTYPAPDGSVDIRPETRIIYSSLSARYLTAPSTYSNGPAMWLPVAISSCRSASVGDPDSCVGSATESVTAISYPSGVPNNLLPTSVTSKAGDNTLNAATSYAYDNYGRTTTVDGPLSADQLLRSYRLDGRLEWQIGPDPDGSGSALFPAVKYNYRSDGQIDYVQTGTVTSQSSGAWSSFTEYQRQTNAYDTHSRLSRQTISSGGTAYQVSDVVYDSGSRVLCTVLRLDGLSSPGSLLTGCTPPQTTSTNGPDRVTLNHYDALGRVWKVTSAYGVSGQEANERTATFTNNGLLSTLTDAEGNMTTYDYDGHDRLSLTRFPSPTTDGTSSTTDFEAVGYWDGSGFHSGYDNNGNVTHFRTRRGEVLDMTYDNLNRLTRKVVPQRGGLSQTHTRDVWFSYDLLGDLGSACFASVPYETSASAECVSNSFNARGQLNSSTTNMDLSLRILGYQYDAAGNLTRLIYPDDTTSSPSHVDYYRHGSGAFDYAAYAGSNALFRQTYDALGRPYRVNRWRPGVGWEQFSELGYDNLSRLTSLQQNPNNSSYDVTTTLAYNPASQIASRGIDNNTYAWLGNADVDKTYANNGLNQFTSNSYTVGAPYPADDPYTAICYDENGNLIGDTRYVYIYDVENRLVEMRKRTQESCTNLPLTGDQRAILRYDPLGRLHEAAGYTTDAQNQVVPTGTTRFLHNGSDLVAEYDTGSPGTIVRRYVHGLGAGDDPMVWFEGSTVGDNVRRYFYADERGSIVTVTDKDGYALRANAYDEYGISASAAIAGSDNAGRFRYTGQAWLPELGMYYYKARMYSPRLGRFMQTDPIGYGGGMNMYGYVGGDPVNFVDPTGLWECRDGVPSSPDNPCDITLSGYASCGSVWIFCMSYDQFLSMCGFWGMGSTCGTGAFGEPFPLYEPPYINPGIPTNAGEVGEFINDAFKEGLGLACKGYKSLPPLGLSGKVDIGLGIIGIDAEWGGSYNPGNGDISLFNSGGSGLASYGFHFALGPQLTINAPTGNDSYRENGFSAQAIGGASITDHGWSAFVSPGEGVSVSSHDVQSEIVYNVGSC